MKSAANYGTWGASLQVSQPDQNLVETPGLGRTPNESTEDAQRTVGALIAAYLRPPVHVSSCFYCL